MSEKKKLGDWISFRFSFLGVAYWWSFSLLHNIPTYFPLFSSSSDRNLPAIKEQPTSPHLCTRVSKQYRFRTDAAGAISRSLWKPYFKLDNLKQCHHVSGMTSGYSEWCGGDTSESRLVLTTSTRTTHIKENVIIWPNWCWWAIWYEPVGHSWWVFWLVLHPTLNMGWAATATLRLSNFIFKIIRNSNSTFLENLAFCC